MKKLHLALSTRQLDQCVLDYSQRLGLAPCVQVAGAYALWRTESLNVSVRQDPDLPAGHLRHLGWEDPQAKAFSQDLDVNGVVWERFTAQQQAEEIHEIWPEVDYKP